MMGKPQLYLLELMIAAVGVGALTLLLHRGFDVMEMQSFFVAITAVGLGLAVFWIYFAPRATTPHQRTLSFITSLIVGMGLAPWVVDPLTEPLFASRSKSTDSIRINLLSNDGADVSEVLEALNVKLLSDGFARRDAGMERIYSRRGVIVSVQPLHETDTELADRRSRRVKNTNKPRMYAFYSQIGWSSQGFWFQVDAIEAEANAYKHELDVWESRFPVSQP